MMLKLRREGKLASVGGSRYAIDTGKAERELGWSPRESLQTGLSRTVGWYLDHPDWTIDSATSGDRPGLGASRKHALKG